jgi:hypothetical protein
MTDVARRVASDLRTCTRFRDVGGIESDAVLRGPRVDFDRADRFAVVRIGRDRAPGCSDDVFARIAQRLACR